MRRWARARAFPARLSARAREAGVADPRRELPRRALGHALLAGLGGAAFAGAPGLVAGLVASPGLLAFSLSREVARRRALAEVQLADALRTMASALRAGRSLTQAIVAANEASAPPLAAALGEAVRRLAVGGDLDAAVGVFVAGCPERSRPLVGLALRIGRVSGGDLPRLLDQAAETVLDRRSVAEDRGAATAQARSSAVAIGAMPLVFFVLVGSRDGRTMRLLLGTPVGWALLSAGLALEVAGMLWVRRIAGAR